MATFHHDGDRVRVHVKGAPEAVLGRCDRVLRDGIAAPLDAGGAAAVERENAALAREGLRVLAMASGELPARAFDPAGDLLAQLDGLTLAGLVGLLDPPRPEAAEALDLCRRAGIEVKMITGDQPATAVAIAARLGLDGEVLTGAQLDAIDAHQLAGRIEDIAVFARVTPEHKMKIVAALKSADIGVGMGITGTDVSKEAATMILTDDNFATIVHAVREGRTLFENIVKFVRFQLSTNVAALATLAVAPLLAMPEPFTPVHILWIAIIMDGPPAIALGFDAARAGLMDEPPRDPASPVLDRRRAAGILWYGAIMAVATLIVFDAALDRSSEQEAITLAFTTFVFFQLFNVFNARSEYGTAFTRQFVTNAKLWGALAGVAILQLLAVQWGPAQAFFDTTGLSGAQWALAVAVASSVLALEEARKAVLRLARRGGTRAAAGANA